MSKAEITFKWNKDECEDAYRNGERIAVVAVDNTTDRWYWYSLTEDGPISPYNTLLVAGSAQDEEGCKAELIEFFNSHKKKSLLND